MKKKLVNYLVLIFSLYALVGLSRDFFSLVKKGERIKEMEKEVEALRKKNEALKRRWEYVKSDEFVEREARNKLDMAKKDEVIVVLPEDLEVKPLKLEGEEENLPPWQQWLRLFFW